MRREFFTNYVVTPSNGYLRHSVGDNCIFFQCYKDFHFLSNLRFGYYSFSNLLLGYNIWWRKIWSNLNVHSYNVLANKNFDWTEVKLTNTIFSNKDIGKTHEKFIKPRLAKEDLKLAKLRSVVFFFSTTRVFLGLHRYYPDCPKYNIQKITGYYSNYERYLKCEIVFFN